MLKFIHRDILSKIIQLDDFVIWSNGKYNSQLQVCRVVGMTAEKINLLKQDGRQTRVSPSKTVVITQQVHHNIENHVGANA